MYNNLRNQSFSSSSNQGTYEKYNSTYINLNAAAARLAGHPTSSTTPYVPFLPSSTKLAGCYNEPLYLGLCNKLKSFPSSSLPVPSNKPLNMFGLQSTANIKNIGCSASRKPCNCKRSKCLQKYCDCFAAGYICSTECSCVNCYNCAEHSDEREKAIREQLVKDPSAFAPKVKQSENNLAHSKGCNCRRSGCVKKYCECFMAGIKCSEACRCKMCQNSKDGLKNECEKKSDTGENVVKARKGRKKGLKHTQAKNVLQFNESKTVDNLIWNRIKNKQLNFFDRSKAKRDVFKERCREVLDSPLAKSVERLAEAVVLHYVLGASQPPSDASKKPDST